MKRVLVLGLLLVAAAGVALFAGGQGWLGEHEAPGVIRGPARAPERVAAEVSLQRRAAAALAAGEAKQILFCELHEHTTF